MRLKSWLVMLLILTIAVIPSSAARLPGSPAEAQESADRLAATGDKQAYAYLYGNGSAFQKQVLAAKGCLNGVFLPWLETDETGLLHTRQDLRFLDWLHQGGLKAYPYLTNHFDRTAGDLALSPERQATLVAEIIAFIDQTGCDGVNIDLENFSPGNKAAFVSFLQALAQPLHSRGKQLSVAVPATANPNPAGWAAAYDYQQIAATADRVIIMAYDEHWANSEPGPVASLSWVDRVVANLSLLMPPGKTLLGLPFYGRHWINGQNGTGIGYSEALKLAALNATPLEWRPEKGVFRLQFEDAAGTHELWLENQTTLQAKIGLTHRYNLAGVAAWRLGFEDPKLWPNFGPWLQHLAFSDTKNHWAVKDIARLVSTGLAAGTPDGRFDPDRGVTRAEAIYLLAQTLNLPPGASLPFIDVPPGHWAHDAATRAFRAGWLSGRPDGSLDLDQPVTRAEMALLVQKAYGLTLSQPLYYPDVPFNHFAARAIATLTTQGWVQGFEDGCFKPDQTVTRAEMAVLVAHTLPAKT
ncbi:MAG: S-layer homology domain-containing protein [Heliobacteriaceae bacterium]|nr:S-layer homology domain-containing protein [Heliobacteriaceae bacterium]